MSSPSHNVTEMANWSLCNAKSCIRRGHYGAAFTNFLLFLKLDPSRRAEVRDEFILASREWSEELLLTRRLEELFTCYSQACHFFPDCEEVLNNIGAQLFRLGYTEEAAEYIRRALKVNPKFWTARENFENICGHLVERWHFRMLNDTRRNKCYLEAIQRGVSRGGTSVLDIGAGTGLLSMIAVTCGADRVYACERSKTMYNIGREVLMANNMSDKVRLVHKSSTDLIIPADIPQRVPLVVTETFDAGLFGEQILSTLKHAWEHLMLRPGTSEECHGGEPVLIPSAAQMYVCAIECEAIRKHNRCEFPGVQGLDLSSVEILCDTGTVQNEPYTTEELRHIRGGYKQLSDVIPLLRVDFCDPQEIRHLLDGRVESLSCPVTQSGRLDALAVWFDLHLDDITTISTSPREDNCWHQAIFPTVSLPNTLGNCEDHNLLVQKGDCLRVEYVCKDDKLTVHCLAIDRASEVEELTSNTECSCSSPQASPQHQEIQKEDREDWNLLKQTPGKQSLPKLCLSETMTFPPNEYLPEQTLMMLGSCEPSKHTCCSKSSTSHHKSVCMGSSPSSPSVKHSHVQTNSVTRFFLPRCKIGQLNDVTLNRTMSQVLQEVYANFRQKLTNLTFLEYSQGLSPFGLQALQVGFDRLVLILSPDEGEENSADMEILTKLMKQNSIEKDKVCMLESFVNKPEDIPKADCIFVDLVEPSGVLNQQVLENLALMRLTWLAPDGVILPTGVSVHGMLIESQDLHKSSVVVGDSWTLGYHIAEMINEFQMSTHVDIDLTTLCHKRLSDSVKLLDLQFNPRFTSPEDSEGNDDIPAFLKMESEVCVPVTDTGTLTAVVFWYDIHLWDSSHITTLESDSHWRQAAVMVQDNMVLSPTQTLRLNVCLKNSCFRITEFQVSEK